MGKASVKLNYEELKKLKEQIMLFGDPTQIDQFLTSCAKELAARLLRKVIKRTPVGQYPKGSGKTGGTLRRGWTAGKSSNAANYANSLNVNKVGTDYVIEIINPVEYASYVEYGHRTRNHKGWVEGHFMLTISEDEIRNAAPKILEKKLKDYLKGCFS
jgi:hypothetical protein